jgi:hypothetical protein
MQEITLTVSKVAVSTLPKRKVDPMYQQIVERAVGRYMRVALGIEAQRAFGLHDEEMAPAHHCLLYGAALEVEIKAAIRDLVSEGEGS